jgi:hypothetical protein
MIRRKRTDVKPLKKKSKYSSEPLEAGGSEDDVKMENMKLSKEPVDEKQ